MAAKGKSDFHTFFCKLEIQYCVWAKITIFKKRLRNTLDWTCNVICFKFSGEVPKNGLQIVRQFLEESGVDISSLKVFAGSPRIRKCKRG